MVKEKIGVIIAAAGDGKRMGSKIPKQFIKLSGQPIAFKSARAFLAYQGIEEVIFVTKKEYVDFVQRELPDVKVVQGGDERQDSIYRGIKALSGDIKYVLVHDGARPFVSKTLIDRVVNKTKEKGAAICGVKVKDTIRTKHQTLKRDELIAIQTPQGFRKNILEKAYREAIDCGYSGTDDASLVEQLGVEVFIVEGDYKNIKITTKEDLPMEMRVGQGYDVHQLVDERKLILGGVLIPFEKGLKGHSDADVLIHAVMDSILGALGKGDIGKHFPDNDDEFKDISSMKLLKKVKKIMEEEGYSIANIDVTIIAQKPKLSPYTEDMKNNIANCMSIEDNKINIKATTTEGLGFCGREEGIAAQSVCILNK